MKNRADFHMKLLPHDHRSRYEKEQANQIWKNVRPQGTTKGFCLFAIFHSMDCLLCFVLFVC